MSGGAPIGLAVLAGLLLGFAGSSQAVPVTWEFEGRVEYRWATDGTPDGEEELIALLTGLGVQPGVPLSGRFVLESTTPDMLPEAGIARYLGAGIRSDLTIGSYVLSSDSFHGDPIYSGGSVTAFNNTMSGFSTLSVTSYLGDEIGLLGPYGLMSLDLSSMNPMFFTAATESFPLDPPALSDIDPFTPGGYGTHLYVRVATDIAHLELYASISRLERVPEPSLTLLLAPAALALRALRRRAR